MFDGNFCFHQYEDKYIYFKIYWKNTNDDLSYNPENLIDIKCSI